MDIQVYGTDGLVVRGSEFQVMNGAFDAGEALNLEVEFTPVPSHSNLAVIVSGRFAGSLRSRVVSFTVGNQTLRSKQSSDTTFDEKGEPIIIMPAESY